MGEHVHEEVNLEVDSSQLTGEFGAMSNEEKVQALLEALDTNQADTAEERE